MTFQDLHLISPLLANIRDAGYTVPTPIQEATIPLVLDGDDVLGCAQTGTGKTASFALPILQRLLQLGATFGQEQQLDRFADHILAHAPQQLQLGPHDSHQHHRQEPGGGEAEDGPA